MRGEAQPTWFELPPRGSLDFKNREDIASPISKALAHEVLALVLVNNEAEGCAAASIAELARTIGQRQLLATSP